jgi:hypothetical protein
MQIISEKAIIDMAYVILLVHGLGDYLFPAATKTVPE